MPQMMNAQFATMRYPGPYPGMEQHNMAQVQMHHQPQHQLMPPHMAPFVPPVQDGSAVVPIVENELAQPVDVHPGHAQQQQQTLPQQPGVPMQYPPNAYYGGGMPMHPAQQRAPHMGGYHPQMVGGPQQIPVRFVDAKYFLLHFSVRITNIVLLSKIGCTKPLSTNVWHATAATTSDAWAQWCTLLPASATNLSALHDGRR
jgi:hypothetical protein